MSRAKLLNIAVREFGAKGLDGAATRDIAAAAGTAMSAITYHYGGKEALYLAAADHIAQHMADALAPALAAEEGVRDDPAAARAALHRLTDRLVQTITERETADWSLFIMREQLTPGEAFERIWAGMMGQLTRRVAELVQIATGVALPAARTATVTLMGQIMTMRASRAAVLRLCEVDELDDATLAAITGRIHSNIDAVLDRMGDEERP